MLCVGGYDFTNPPPMITAEGIKPFPNKGARQLHSRTSFLYTATGITPAMCMRLTNVGSQYLAANVDSTGEPFDGAKTYRLRLPKDIPAARFWSFTALRQPDPLHAADAAALPAGRQPDVPHPGSGERSRDGSDCRLLLTHPA